MKLYKVIYSKAAEKFINSNRQQGVKFIETFADIAANSGARYDIVKYKGKQNCYRLRIGQYRAIFEVRESELVILVIDIDSRGGIYK